MAAPSIAYANHSMILLTCIFIVAFALFPLHSLHFVVPAVRNYSRLVTGLAEVVQKYNCSSSADHGQKDPEDGVDESVRNKFATIE